MSLISAGSISLDSTFKLIFRPCKIIYYLLPIGDKLRKNVKLQYIMIYGLWDDPRLML